MIINTYLYTILLFLGGNLGLFTGMSILSMFEVVFWILRIMFARKQGIQR